MLTGKRYDTPYDEYKAERVQGFSISDEDLHSPVGDVIEESLPDELEEQLEEDTKGSERTLSAENQSSDKKTEASLKALDMLDKGLLTERAVLAVIGHMKKVIQLHLTFASKPLSSLSRINCQNEGLLLFWAFKHFVKGPTLTAAPPQSIIIESFFEISCCRKYIRMTNGLRPLAELCMDVCYADKPA
jgi:hypothetical protein